MKKPLFILFSLFITINQFFAQSVTITESAGWLESAYVKWQPVSGAESYNVYYTGGGITDKKIDTQLIRSYGTYFRADIPGLKAGTYTIKIKPVVAGVEGTETTSGTLTVLAQDRTGFAFSNGRVPGAYKADGTPKDNAIVIYITQNTKNTISMNVTGANANPCVGLQAILDGFKKGKDTRPLIVRLVGQITDLTTMTGGDIVIENANNASSYITLEGIGDDAVADGWGIRIKNASNIEVKNIGSMNCDSDEGDNVGLQQDNDYIWVHHCDLFYGNAGSDADQIKGDGAMDCKKSTYVTFAYNHFWDSGKCNLLGLSEGSNDGLFITYHHNWYDHSDSRHPRVRYYSAHVFNNYYDGNSKYGAGSTLGSSVFVEANYFRNCKYPILTSMQGSDVWDETKQANDYANMPIFSSEDGGSIKAFNNYMSGQKRFVPYGASGYPNSTVDFDAYVATTRNETVSSSIVSNYGKNTYNNFDTNASVMYAYTPDSPEEARTKVMNYAGRVTGGDLKWTFNNAVDDASYTVNAPLKAALTGYKTKLVAVQGESGTTISTHTLVIPANNNQTVTNGTAIETIIFSWGGDATDVTVTGLPASGISYVKDATAKTVTISGTPAATVSYSVTTIGASGTPVTGNGTITVTTGGNNPVDVVHDFTASGKTSTFFTITGNLSTGYGTATYAGLTLTQCLKMESSTNISFTTTKSGTLTLVFGSSYTGSVKVDATTITPTAGIISVDLAPGAHTIIKGSGSNYLFYMAFSYLNTGVVTSSNLKAISYPNPFHNIISFNSDLNLHRIEVYNLAGKLIFSTDGSQQEINLSNLNTGVYLLKIQSEEGNFNQMIFKQ